MKLSRKNAAIVRYAAAAAVLLALSALLLYISARKKPASYQAPPPAVKTERPRPRTIEQSVTLSAYVEAEATVPVVPLVSGTIMEYPIKAGDVVESGQLLALIDEAPFKQQMLQAQAAYWGYQSGFERAEQLFKANAVTRQEYDTLKAQRDAAKAQYELAELQLGYARVTAPVSGTVLIAPQAKGNIGTQTQPVAVIADLNNQVVKINAPEKYFSVFNRNADRLKAVARRPLSDASDSPEESCVCELDTIAPYIKSGSKTFEVVFKLTENAQSFRPGMFVKVTIIYDSRENAPSLPLTVLKTDGSCYAYDEQSKTARMLSFTPEADDGQYFIVPDRYAQCEFITEGQHNIFDGQTVVKIDSGTGGAAETSDL